MKTVDPPVIRLRDYTAPAFVLEKVELIFDLEPETTIVESRLSLRACDGGHSPLVLDGEEMDLLSIALDGKCLDADAYQCDDQHLILRDLPQECQITIRTRINPKANTKLEGLYKSGSIYCTQCEAEGFRRITYFPDRPDVMSVYKVTLRANKKRNPVLLSNGNKIEQGDLPDGRHYAIWEDPFPKPSYLFALVAGNLAEVADQFVTRSGRKINLKIFVEHGNENRCRYAMAVLKRAMRWDETRFGLEYDLDIFNIVAVSDFNMGAMENKSLNIFNAKYILADRETATDLDFSHIEGIIAHEYFHNWSGNRVTCRDWFQLSLKEGLTVFRDQEFSADQRSAAVKRIQDVKLLRARQFPEDAGPLAHPVRPESYIEINNFYTATVYEKGAEIIRMLQSLLGEEVFQQGCRLYFERHDGQAVTCDDFIAAMAAAGKTDLRQFKRWYSQAGTPKLHVQSRFDAKNATCILTLSQSTAPTPGQKNKQALHIPVKIAFLGQDGEEQMVTLNGHSANEHLLELSEYTQQFVFENLETRPVLSVNRDFSAPVILHMQQSNSDRAFLLAHDPNSFSRWEAGQQYGCDLLLDMVGALQAGRPVCEDEAYLAALGRVIESSDLEPAYKALLLTLPGEDYLADQMEMVDVDAIHQAREKLRQTIARRYHKAFRLIYDSLSIRRRFSPDASQAGQRALRNLALSFLVRADPEGAADLLRAHFDAADNMTDSIAALGELCQLGGAARDHALADFLARWSSNEQAMDKWLNLQAVAKNKDTLQRVRRLMHHPVFSFTNPNKIRALIGAFAMANPLCFHASDGSGYAFLADQVISLNAVNPQIAARLLGPLGQWRRFDANRQRRMKAALSKILKSENLSKDVFEIASKALNI